MSGVVGNAWLSRTTRCLGTPKFGVRAKNGTGGRDIVASDVIQELTDDSVLLGGAAGPCMCLSSPQKTPPISFKNDIDVRFEASVVFP